MAKVGVQTISNVEYDIHATSGGNWMIVRQGEEGTLHERTVGNGNTLEQAVQNARAQLAKEKVKLNIHFITYDGERGIAVGKHARNRTILLRINGKASAIEGYRAEMLKPDTPQEDIDRLLEIENRIAKLMAEKREIIEEWKFDLSKAVDAAIEEATQ